MSTIVALFPPITSCKRLGTYLTRLAIIPLGLVSASLGADALLDLLM